MVEFAHFWIIVLMCALPLEALRFAVVGGFGGAASDAASRIISDAVSAAATDLILGVGGVGLGCVDTACSGSECGLSDSACAAQLDANIGQYWHGSLSPYSGGHGSGPSDGVNRYFPSVTAELGFASGASAVRAAYDAFFSGVPGNRRYYDFVRGPVHFFALDSTAEYEEDGTNATSAQAAWLRARLAASTAKHRVVYFTAAPYASASTSSARGAHWMRWPFGAWGATLVLSTSATAVGSAPSNASAMYERLTALDGTPHIVNDLGGARTPRALQGSPLGFSEFRWASGYGYVLVTADDYGMTVEFTTVRASAINASNRTWTVTDRVQVAPFLPSLTFGTIGDFGKDNAANARVSAAVRRLQPDIVVTTGDNNYPDGATETIDAHIGKYYSEFIHPYKGRYGSNATINRFFPTLGNHDWVTEGAVPYLDYFSGLPGNRRYYDFVRGPVHFFVVDSDKHEPDGTRSTSTQGQWIIARLRASRSPHRVVVFHHPVWSSRVKGGDHPSMDWAWDKLGATLVLTGHSHNYERFERNGLAYVVNGAGAARFHEFGAPRPGSLIRYRGSGFMRSTVLPSGSLRSQFLSLSDGAIDEFDVQPFTTSSDETVRIAVISDAAATLTASSPTFASVVTPDAFDVVATLGGNSLPGWTTADVDAVLGKHLSGFMAPYYGVHGTPLTTRYVNAFLPTFGDASAEPWLNYFPRGFRQGQSNATAESPSPLYYTARHGPVQFFMLDTTAAGGSGTAVDGAQARWLQGALAASTAPHRVVCMHVPPTCNLCNVTNPDLLQWPFRSWGATLLLSSGSQYERLLLPNGSTLVVVGTSSTSSARRASSLDLVLLKLDANATSLSVVATLGGDVVDAIALDRRGTIMLAQGFLTTAPSSPSPSSPSTVPTVVPTVTSSLVPTAASTSPSATVNSEIDGRPLSPSNTRGPLQYPSTMVPLDTSFALDPRHPVMAFVVGAFVSLLV